MSDVLDRFKFEALSPKAQQRAIEWYRRAESEDWEPDYVVDDCVTCMAFLGIDVDTDRKGKRAIMYSVAWTQGDGAMFTGGWKAADMDIAGLIEYAPKDEELHRLGAQLMAVLLRWPDSSAGIGMSRAGFGFGYMTVEEGDGTPDDKTDDELNALLKGIVRDVAQWIYTRLRDELEYATSDKVVIEGIIANDYDFDEDGGGAL